MKIYEKLVIDIDSGEVIEEQSFEYDGPLALAMPDLGGGSGGAMGDAAGQASQEQIMGLQVGAGTFQKYLDQAIDAIEKQYGMAAGSLQDFYGKGVGSLTDYFGKAQGFLQPYADIGTSAQKYAAGLAGVPGYGAVDPTQALRSTPGYQWQLGQGINALKSAGAATGQYGSGAMGKGLMQYGQGLADQTYNQFYNRIAGLGQQGLGASGQLGQWGMQTGQGLAGLAQGTGAGLAGTYGSYGSNLANTFLSGGQGLANLYGQIGGAAAQGTMQNAAYNAQDQMASGGLMRDMLGGLGLLGGFAMSPMPAGGFGGTWLGGLLGGAGI